MCRASGAASAGAVPPGPGNAGTGSPGAMNTRERPMPDHDRPARVRPGAAIVLAAGEGTRMRSAMPKVLHPIAGRSLLGARRARRRGAGARTPRRRGRARPRAGRREPGRAGERLARPVLAAVQDEQLGTGHAVRCALDALPAGAGRHRCWSSYGDVPLLETDDPGRAARRARRTGARCHRADQRAGRPDRLRAGAARRRTAPSRRSSSRRDATPEQRAIARGQLRGLRLRRRLPARRAARGCAPANSQGELYLTDVVAHRRRRRAPGRRALRCADHVAGARASTTGCSWPRCAPS